MKSFSVLLFFQVQMSVCTIYPVLLKNQLGYPALLGIFIVSSVSLPLCLFVSLLLCLSVSLSLFLCISLLYLSISPLYLSISPLYLSTNLSISLPLQIRNSLLQIIQKQQKMYGIVDNTCSELGYCYHSVNVISLILDQNDHIKRLLVHTSRFSYCYH